MEVGLNNLLDAFLPSLIFFVSMRLFNSFHPKHRILYYKEKIQAGPTM